MEKELLEKVLHAQEYGIRAAALRKLLDNIKGEIAKEKFSEEMGAMVVHLVDINFVIDGVIEMI